MNKNLTSICNRILVPLMAVTLCINSCTNDNLEEDYSFKVHIDDNLENSNSNCGELQLSNDWQTLHRVSATITESGTPIENVKFHWESSLFWYLGDTLGYIVKRGLTDDLVYKNYDTLYIIGFNGEEVPTSNMVSYSNANGIVNNMIAPVRSMKGDTLTLRWWYEYENYQSNWDSIKICLK